MNKKKIIITGGGGYIGCHVVEEFLKLDYKVIVIDRFSFDANSLEHLKHNKKPSHIKRRYKKHKKIFKIILKTPPQ